MKIALYSDDINLLTYWEKVFNSYEVVEEFENLFELRDTIIVLNYSSFAEVIRASIKRFSKKNNFVLVLHRAPNLAVAKQLLKAGVRGYGNAFMKDFYLHSAVDAIKDNMVWLYPEYTTQLILDLEQGENVKNTEILNALTSREQEVVLLLKDGLTYKQIATELDIGVRTTKTHIQNSYVKLQVKDRLSLALLFK